MDIAKNLVDFHSHVLPGIDDGSPDLDTSIQMLKMAYAQGIETVVATPHFDANYDTPESFLSRRNEAEALLRKEMEKHDDMPRLHVGAEVFYFSGISDSVHLMDLTIDKTPFILVEMPTCDWTDHMYAELEGINLKQGLIPIVAHLDRYIRPIGFGRMVRQLRKLPVLIQCNTEFFQRPSTQRKAWKMLRKGSIHLLGSDCHDTRHRPPDLGNTAEQICKSIGDQWLNHISLYQDDILNGLRRIL